MNVVANEEGSFSEKLLLCMLAVSDYESFDKDFRFLGAVINLCSRESENVPIIKIFTSF